MQYVLTRRNLEIAYAALEYAMADAVEELMTFNKPLSSQGRDLLNNIDFAKTVIKATVDALGDSETGADAEVSH